MLYGFVGNEVKYFITVEHNHTIALDPFFIPQRTMED